MNSVTKYNLSRYNNADEFDKYSQWKNHKLRIEIMINFVLEVFNKGSKNIKKFRILDVGGNTGVISKLLKDKGFDVTVADISEKALKTCQKKKLKTIKFDFNEKFPLEDETFDVVIAGEVIEHVLDVELFLNECNRILKSDGHLVISTPNLSTLKDRIGFLFGFMPRQINPHHEYLKLHIRQFNYRSLKYSLSLANFKIIKFKSNYFIINKINGDPIFIRSLGVLFPKISASLIMLVQKQYLK